VRANGSPRQQVIQVLYCSLVEFLLMLMDRVPNVLGMGLRDALYILENRGLRVRIQGSGMVKKQSLQPGDRAVHGSTIVIELT
jgi:beta-lactam-binding protein with PASTA domain